MSAFPLWPAKCLLSTYYVPGPLLGAGDKAVIYSFIQTQTLLSTYYVPDSMVAIVAVQTRFLPSQRCLQSHL